MMNDFVNIKYINNKLSNSRVSTILNKILKEDKQKKFKRVLVFTNGIKNKKHYFIHDSCKNLIQRKRVKNIIDKSELFVSVMVKNQNCCKSFFIEFIHQFKKFKPLVKVGFVIEGSSTDAHLHFIVEMSQKQLLRTIKKIVNTQYFQILKYNDLHLKKVQTDYYTPNTNSPIYITNVTDINGLANNYLIKQSKMKYI